MRDRIRASILSLAAGFVLGFILIILASLLPIPQGLVKATGLLGVPYYAKLAMLIFSMLTLEYICCRRK